MVIPSQPITFICGVFFGKLEEILHHLVLISTPFQHYFGSYDCLHTSKREKYIPTW